MRDTCRDIPVTNFTVIITYNWSVGNYDTLQTVIVELLPTDLVVRITAT